MAINKKNAFSLLDQELATFSKALSHPARVAILTYLAEQDACMCGDIVHVLPLAQSTVSQHLKELQNVGLIKGTIEGPKTCYCIDYDNYTRLSQKMNSFLNGIVEPSKTCC